MPRQRGRITSPVMALRRTRIRRPRASRDLCRAARAKGRPRIRTLERDARDGDGALSERARTRERERARKTAIDRARDDGAAASRRRTRTRDARRA